MTISNKVNTLYNFFPQNLEFELYILVQLPYIFLMELWLEFCPTHCSTGESTLFLKGLKQIGVL